MIHDVAIGGRRRCRPDGRIGEIEFGLNRQEPASEFRGWFSQHTTLTVSLIAICQALIAVTMLLTSDDHDCLQDLLKIVGSFIFQYYLNICAEKLIF